MRMLERSCDIYVFYACSRVCAAESLCIDHTLYPDIIDIYPGAKGLLDSIDTSKSFGDHSGLGIDDDGSILSQVSCRHHDRFLDLHIAGTSADIPSQGFLNLFKGRIVVHIQKSFCRHDHPRGAEAALNGTLFGETVGIDILLALRQSLYRDDLFAFHTGKGYEA